MGISNWITLIGIGVGVIGIIVGIIGGKSLKTVNEIKNNANNLNNSIVQQAQTITVNNGLDKYAVIKISKETTQEELLEIVERLNNSDSKMKKFEKKLSSYPKIHVDKTKPKIDKMKEGDIWLRYND